MTTGVDRNSVCVGGGEGGRDIPVLHRHVLLKGLFYLTQNRIHHHNCRCKKQLGKLIVQVVLCVVFAYSV